MKPATSRPLPKHISARLPVVELRIMHMGEEVVEVISVTRAIESSTGDSIYQVQFGHMVEVNEEMRKSIPQPVGAAPPKMQGSIALIIFGRFSGPVPYRVGSKWNMSIKESGALTLREARG
jgi:hypothetical protein